MADIREKYPRAGKATPAAKAPRQIVDARSRHFTDDELLDGLRAIVEQQGCLSGLIIDEQEGLGH